MSKLVEGIGFLVAAVIISVGCLAMIICVLPAWLFQRWLQWKLR